MPASDVTINNLVLPQPAAATAQQTSFVADDDNINSQDCQRTHLTQEHTK